MSRKSRRRRNRARGKGGGISEAEFLSWKGAKQIWEKVKSKAAEKLDEVANPPRRGTPNKWEQNYFDSVLKPRYLTGEITLPMFEAVRLRYYSGGEKRRAGWYTGDWSFVERATNELVIHEVKGHQWAASMVRVSAAAEAHRERVRIYLVEGGPGEWRAPQLL